MAFSIPLKVNASPRTVRLAVDTPVEQVVNTDYERLSALPKINGVTLLGDKSAEDLGLATPSQLPSVPGDVGACPAIRQGSVSLSATWSGNGPYTQTVTVTGATVTSNSKIDLQPDATALAQLISDGVTALFVTNNAGTLSATAIGAATTAALTIQCTVTEVSA